MRNVTIDVVSAAGDKLWKELVGPLNSTKPLSAKITHVSLSFHGVEVGEANQRGIEGFLSKAPSTPSKRKRKANSDDEEEADEVIPLPSHGELEPRPDIDYFVCDRCEKRMGLPQELMGASELDEDIKRDVLRSLRVEHQDFHFAQDLSRMPSDDERSERPNLKPKVQVKKRKMMKGEGIAKFFSKQ